MGVEVFAGIQSHSLALLSDAGHNFTDGLALLLAWLILVFVVLWILLVGLPRAAPLPVLFLVRLLLVLIRPGLWLLVLLLLQFFLNMALRPFDSRRHLRYDPLAMLLFLLH